MATIPPDRIKTEREMLNDILLKKNEYGKPRFTLLLGAGASYGSKVPLAIEVIGWLQKIIT